MRKNLLILLAVLFLGFVAFIIFSADAGSMPKFIANLYNFPNGDKVGHFFLMGSLAFVVALVLPRNWKLRGLLILTGLLALEEFSQRFFQHRTSDWLDLASSFAEVTVFGTLNWWLTATKESSPANGINQENK